jgi:hypothetical protein
MVDLIPVVKKHTYPNLKRKDLPEGRRYIYGEQKLPSVTTIISKTKDTSGLDAWAERIGKENAEKIKNDAASVGTHMHNVIERMVAYRDLPRPTNWLMIKGYEMGYKLVNTYFKYLEEIWGSEVSVYYPGKYAGTMDMIGIYRGKLAVIDFKQSKKPKKSEWIEDYFHQLAAYAVAHDKLFNTEINFGVILVSVQDGTTQEFTTTGYGFENHKKAWLKRVDDFYAEGGLPTPSTGSNGNKD